MHRLQLQPEPPGGVYADAAAGTSSTTFAAAMRGVAARSGGRPGPDGLRLPPDVERWWRGEPRPHITGWLAEQAPLQEQYCRRVTLVWTNTLARDTYSIHPWFVHGRSPAGGAGQKP
jgi:hypothetical protein